jgi:hypothetical protein
MFHIELRQAPHRLHRFNLQERELRATVLEPWARGASIEMGERIWDPSKASIVVLEGPEIAVGRLTMGRGWAIAHREGTDVSTQAIAAIRQSLAEAAAEAVPATLAAGASTAPASAGIALTTQVAPADAAVLADALGLELLRGLGETPLSLPGAWRIAAERYPQLTIGAALDLARGAVSSLVRSRLVRLAAAGIDEGGELGEEDLQSMLASIDCWTLDAGPSSLWIRRA